MRLIFVIDSFMIGGSELAALRTYKLLRETHEIAIVHFHDDGPLYKDYQDAGAEMHHVPLFGFRDPRNVAALLRLRKLISELQPDLLHSHDAYSNMVVLAALWPRFGTPWVSSRRWLDQIVRPTHARLNHIAFTKCSAVTVNASTVANHMVEAEGIERTRLAVIPNFVEIPAETVTWPYKRNGFFTVGMVSRLTPIKRHDIAVHALRRLIDEGLDVRLSIVGDGESRHAIQAQVEELGLSSRVELKGELRGGAALHADFDISLSTSDSEGSPNSVLEGMAAGRPIVATDVGGTRDVLRPGVDGLLVPPGDSGAVADALRTIIVRRDLLHAYGDAGRARAVAEFSPDAIAERLDALYAKLVVKR